MVLWKFLEKLLASVCLRRGGCHSGSHIGEYLIVCCVDGQFQCSCCELIVL